MSIETNVLIAELQHQIIMFSSRAAQHAIRLAAVTAERDVLVKEREQQLDDTKGKAEKKKK